MFSSRHNTPRYSPDNETGAVYVKYFFGEEGMYGRISGGMRVSELAADNREAALGKGARYSSTIMLTLS
jgi:hypothetical protein